MAFLETIKRFTTFSGIRELLPAIFLSVLDSHWPYVFTSPEKYPIDLVKRLLINF